jgi:creatinine amidohydrolase
MRLVIIASVFAALALSPTSQQPSSQPNKGITLSEISWREAEAVLGPDSVVVIPVGAAAKEHGLHLKLGNDLTLAEYFTRRVVGASKVVVAPTLTYHFYPAFLEYPGSTSLNLETARTMTLEVVRSLARNGPRRFYALNTGISTARPLSLAAETLAREGVLFGYTDLGPRLDQASANIRKQEGGTHADEIETSMMLYIDPSVVDMTRAVKEFRPGGTGRLTRQRTSTTGSFSESGVWGDPTLATREKGSLVVEALVTGMLEDIETIRRSPLPVPARVTPTSAAPAAPRPPALTAGSRGCTPGEERTIRSLGEALSTHWTNGDAVKYALMWSEDGDMVHPDGFTERGNKTLLTNRFELFNRKEYRGSQQPVVLANVHCLNQDVAVVDGKWELRGASDGSGKVLPIYEGLCTLVVKRGGPLSAWLIEAYRYTIKPTAVPLPTWLKRPGWPDK